MIRYCKRCILPTSRPGIVLDDEGVCSGCRGHDDKGRLINWEKRKGFFQEIIDEAKARSSGYDCIVPVSGGKDSWYQVITAKKYGLKPLCVTWRTPARTEIGQINLDRMVKNLGVDHIDFTIDPDVERRFMIEAFERVGDPGLPMHMALFNIPARIAQQMRIPLVIWGENPQLEFGGDEKERLATDLDDNWRAKHGCMMGTSPTDWVGDALSKSDLQAYELPPGADFVPRSIFLGAFFPWNSFDNAKVARERGFIWDEGKPLVGSWDFADVDCRFISLHHFPKWHKFGMTRTWDNLSQQIRYGTTTRDQAVAHIRKHGFEVPTADIELFCKFAGKPVGWFWQTCEKFRNTSIWQQKGNIWTIPGFLIDQWNWNDPKQHGEVP